MCSSGDAKCGICMGFPKQVVSVLKEELEFAALPVVVRMRRYAQDDPCSKSWRRSHHEASRVLRVTIADFAPEDKNVKPNFMNIQNVTPLELVPKENLITLPPDSSTGNVGLSCGGGQTWRAVGLSERRAPPCRKHRCSAWLATGVEGSGGPEDKIRVL